METTCWSMQGHTNNKGIEFQCSLSVLDNGPALLGRPYCEKLHPLYINFNTMDDKQKEDKCTITMIHTDYSDVFSEIGCFIGTLSL